MIKLSEISRFAAITTTVLQYRIDRFLLHDAVPIWIKSFVYLNPLNLFYTNKISRGRRLRLALQKLGPIFVKFGQILSTRRDVFPSDIVDELALLQDQVAPFATAEVEAILNKAYDGATSAVFAELDLQPLASASVAQVHAATLHNSDQVVVKILRPNIKAVIQRDINLMYRFAHLLESMWSQGTRLHSVELVAEFERHIFDELDLIHEAANASQLRRNFAESRQLYVPEVYWQYTSQNVMVMERIYGIPVSDIAALKQAGINFKRLAEIGVEIFFTQVFRDCFFHADMHPGNIFVSPDHRDEPQYLGVDFGIIGSLTPVDQRYLAENFLAFFQRNYRRVAELHVESGWVPRDTRVNDLESAIRTVCEPIFDRPLKDISFGHLLLRLFQTAGRFNMEVQPQLLMLQKTLLNVEGLGRQLYPELDLWQTAKPFLEDWLKQRVGVRALVKRVRQEAPFWLEKLPELPDLVYRALQRAATEPVVAPTVPVKTQPQQRWPAFIAGVVTVIVLSQLFKHWPQANQWLSQIILHHSDSLVVLISLVLLLMFVSTRRVTD